MKLLIFTDPHRGYNENTSKIHDKVFSSINPDSFDIVVVSGDWGVSCLDHVRGAFKAFRRAFPNKPIVGVLGNHDLWDSKTRSLERKFQKIAEFAKESNIHLLENNPLDLGDTVILGFDGWYAFPHPDTNDSNFIHPWVEGVPVDAFLQNKTSKALYSIIDYPKENKKVVVVSHFPCVEEAMDVSHWNGNPRHGEILLEFSDLLIFGHTHKKVDLIKGKTRIINVGNDYNKLEYQIVEI